VFICIKPQSDEHTPALIEEIIAYTKTSTPEHEGGTIAYPGENTLLTRERNLKEGVLVDEKIWNTVLGL
jgi:3-dehydro-L-gulonate 2-dehydrogenase